MQSTLAYKLELITYTQSLKPKQLLVDAHCQRRTEPTA